MRRAAPERKKGLDVEWGERGIERRPPTAEGINAARPPPPHWRGRRRVAGGWVRCRVQRGRAAENKREGTPTPFLKRR